MKNEPQKLWLVFIEIGEYMKTFSNETFQKEQYIHDLKTKLNSVLVDGFLTHEGLEELSKDNLFRIWGVQYQDVRDVDFSKLKKDDFDKLPFSSSTIFPEKMPKFFDKNKLLTFMPANFVRDDKDVCMAVIDNPTQFQFHEFYKGKRIEFVNFSAKNDEAHFHMEGVLSNIFKYAKNPKIIAYSISWRKRHESVLKALKDGFKRIEKGQQIHVVSISNRLTDERTKERTRLKIIEMVENLKQKDCEVVDSAKFFQELNFTAAHKSMFAEEKLENYEFTFNTPGKLGVPVSRVITELGDKNGFAISGSGQSWAIPIVSYFYALCKSKNPNLKIEQFSQVCEKTAKTNKRGEKIVDFEEVLKQSF